MTAVTAVTDRTDHADHSGDDDSTVSTDGSTHGSQEGNGHGSPARSAGTATEHDGDGVVDETGEGGGVEGRDREEQREGAGDGYGESEGGNFGGDFGEGRSEAVGEVRRTSSGVGDRGAADDSRGGRRAEDAGGKDTGGEDAGDGENREADGSRVSGAFAASGASDGSSRASGTAGADGASGSGAARGRALGRSWANSGGGPAFRPSASTGADGSHPDGDGAHARGEGDSRTGTPGGAGSGESGSEESWDDGLIARRLTEEEASLQAASMEPRAGNQRSAPPLAYSGALRSRLEALRELVGLSRTRLDSKTLAEAGQVLDEAAARRKLSGEHTVVAIAGATGSGKSALFNALAGVAISETGVRRPTTAAPVACSWSDGAATLIDRLGIPGRLRRRPLQGPEPDPRLEGLVLIDLPDHDSAAVQHREQVDRVLALVDAVVWVVDPEKYADAVLHERYLRPMAGHAEVMFVVLNQIDRLPGEATHQVLDDLRRLLDEDGLPLGEFGDSGATVLGLSAVTGAGMAEFREALGRFVAERGAPARRISADLDSAARHLRPVYTTGRRAGLSEEARQEFADRLADAVGATAAGEAAERAWLRNANRACGTPWLRLWRWYQGRGELPTGRLPLRGYTDEEATARQRVEQAVRMVSERAAHGLPAPWAQAVREAAVRGAQGLPEALDALASKVGTPQGRPPRPGWWPVAVFAQASMTILQFVGGLWLVGQIVGFMAPNIGVPVLLMALGIVGGPAVEWGSRLAARGPARRYGMEAERRLREAAAGCGRAQVLDPLAAELLRYREVREQYGRVLGAGVAAGVR